MGRPKKQHKVNSNWKKSLQRAAKYNEQQPKKRRSFTLTYNKKSADGETKRQVDPLKVDGNLLKAYDHHRDDLRSFRIERIKDMKKSAFIRGFYKLAAHSMFENWNHRDAAKYGKKLVSQFGPPDQILTKGKIKKAIWHNIAQKKRVCLMDESVPHKHPKPHKDYVYSVRDIQVPVELMTPLATASRSIIVDGLKGEVWARCGTIFANAVTLGFVEDVVDGKVDLKTIRKEYARRIKNDIIPDWYEDEMEEG